MITEEAYDFLQEVAAVNYQTIGQSLINIKRPNSVFKTPIRLTLHPQLRIANRGGACSLVAKTASTGSSSIRRGLSHQLELLKVRWPLQNLPQVPQPTVPLF